MFTNEFWDIINALNVTVYFLTLSAALLVTSHVYI